LVFDVSDRRSFTDLHIWLDDLKQWAEEDVVIMVVGNKSRFFFKIFFIHT
jgi:GTPase SAR1 family protein